MLYEVFDYIYFCNDRCKTFFCNMKEISNMYYNKILQIHSTRHWSNKTTSGFQVFLHLLNVRSSLEIDSTECFRVVTNMKFSFLTLLYFILYLCNWKNKVTIWKIKLNLFILEIIEPIYVYSKMRYFHKWRLISIWWERKILK